MLILSFSVALLIQISKDEKWLIYLLRVTGCPNHGTWTKSCKAMDPSTDLIIYVIYFKMFRFFFHYLDHYLATRFCFHFIRVWWAKRPKWRLLENCLSMSPSGKKKKKMRSFWLDASFSSNVKKVISAIWLALVFFDRLGNESLFRAFSACKS